MGYDPIGELYTGSPKASIDPMLMQQAVEEDEQLKRERERQAQEEQMLQQQEAQAVEQQQQQEAQDAKPLAEIGTAAVGGMIDFVDDSVEAVGKITGQNWEGIPDDFGPQNKTQWGKALRAVVSFIGPTIGVGSIAKGVLTKLALRAGATGLTTGATAFAGKAALDAGVGVGIDAINRNSEDHNLMRVLKDNAPAVVGWAPDDWATLDSDSPDIKRKKNILEGLGLGVLASGIEGMIGFSRMLKGKNPGVEFVPKDDVARKGFQEITNKSPMPKATDPIVDRIVKDEIYRGKTVDEEALRVVNEAGGVENIDDFNPSVHSQVADDYETLGQAVRPDGVAQAMVDAARIRSNVGTFHGRISNFMTSPAIKALGLDGAEGRELVKKIEDNMKKLGNFEVKLPGGKMMTMVDIESAGGDLYAQLVDPNMTGADIHKLFDAFDAREFRELSPKNKVGVVSETGMAAAMNAIKQLKEDFLNMSSARASAYYQTNLAGQVADGAAAVRLSDKSIDPTYIQQGIIENLEALWYETDLNSSVAGWALNNKKLWQQMQGDPLARAKLFSAQAKEMKLAARSKAERAKSFFTELKAMNKSNPEYVAPLMHAYDLTDGEVNSIKKLTDYMQNVLGVTNKAFIDGQPQIPSQVVQGLWATLYNFKLSSLLTPVKALSNNFALLLMKPANVMLGAALRGDGMTVRRAWTQYATHMDTTMKASSSYMSDMFRRVAENPNLTNRADFITQNKDIIQVAREYAAAEATKGNLAPQLKVNFVDLMEKVNNHPWVRYSMNMMESGDGFVKSAVGMAEARGRAFDELVKEGNPITKELAKQIEDRSQEIYKTMFDQNGLITDEAVKYAAGEISMNLDNEIASGLNSLLNKAPILKTLVMFPRTSVNVLDFVHKHSPLSYFMGDLNKVRNLKEVDEISQYLSTKGIQYSDQTWRTYKAEVEGRVAMGSMITLMGGWMFASGNLSGNGNYDKQLNRFQQNVADKPLRSWKNPVTGQWVSYDGIEPISTFLALTADILENVDTLGSTASEKMLQKLGFAVSMNLTNKSFLQGLQPITDMMAGQDSAISRWTSNLFSISLLSQMSRIMTPGLREVDTELQSMLRNKWNILDEVGMGKPLPMKHDFIDGSIVGREDPISNTLNNLLPFKLSSNPSPEKEFLLKSEFDVQPALKSSINKATYNADQRSRLAQIMGESGYFRKGLALLMKDPLIQKDLESIKKLRERGVTSEDADLSQSITHIRLRQLLNTTVNHAKRQLAQEVPDVRLAELKAKQNERALRRANYSALTLTNK
jgi:hypothetical protein